ncbi:MAG: ArsS family sensor histidine kinase [Campylobacteraceae bacterium]|jgi:two-component system OmpR family sensor kinase|nr:ArsS family sensor histidine kinase [Campylobacteraceae bacterium]
MRHCSLKTKANIAFAFSFSILLLYGAFFYMYNNKLNAQKFQNIYLSAFCQNSMLADIKNCLKNLGLLEVDNGQKEIVLKEGSVIQNSVFGNFVIILHKGAYYIQLTDKDSVILFEIKQNGFTNSIYLAFFLIAFIFLAGLYLFTMKNIKSIDKFGKAIKKLADGGINSEIVSANEQDELLKKFDETVKNIADIYNARTLFLRAIMHELKTPIGKGRIVAEMVENHLNKERLIKIFRRLETLIGEFAKTEQLITQNYMFEKQKHSLQKILSLSFDFLMLEPEQLDKRVAKKFPKKSIYINVDLDSMALAFKNLIDNAIKYSSNGCVAISLKKNVLLFANKGKPLDKPITDYKKPFISSDDAVRVRMKMGLGLYIAENILTLHGLTLNYKYKNGYHCFYINLITS